MIYAARRDASFTGHPDTHAYKVMHVVGEGWYALCNQHRIFLDDTYPVPAADVPEGARCRRAACAKAFREADAA